MEELESFAYSLPESLFRWQSILPLSFPALSSRIAAFRRHLGGSKARGRGCAAPTRLSATHPRWNYPRCHRKTDTACFERRRAWVRPSLPTWFRRGFRRGRWWLVPRARSSPYLCIDGCGSGRRVRIQTAGRPSPLPNFEGASPNVFEFRKENANDLRRSGT